MMNMGSAMLWGFVATVVLTAIMSAAQNLGFTRMAIPYMLGAMFTASRRRARIAGFMLHLMNGWIFAFIYVAAFQAWGAAGWWRGAAIGLVHVAFVLTVAMPIMPSMHPRMATEEHGPSPTRQLQPPGFLALHYGYRTPIAATIAHLVYGAILGTFYQLA